MNSVAIGSSSEEWTTVISEETICKYNQDFPNRSLFIFNFKYIPFSKVCFNVVSEDEARRKEDVENYDMVKNCNHLLHYV
jgi:hypothetical protein